MAGDSPSTLLKSGRRWADPVIVRIILAFCGKVVSRPLENGSANATPPTDPFERAGPMGPVPLRPPDARHRNRLPLSWGVDFYT
jgi:hypothetical protein